MKDVSVISPSSPLDSQVGEAIEYINALSNEFIETKVKPNAAVLAVDNRPTKGDKIGPYVDFISAYYQKLQADIAARFRGKVQPLLAMLDISTMEAKITALLSLINTEQRELDKAKIETGDLKDIYDPTELHKHERWLMALGIVEFILFTTAFLSLGFSYLSAIAQGAVFALTQTYALHLAISYLRDTLKRPPSKRLIWTIVVVFVAIIISVGTFRFLSLPSGSGGRPFYMLFVFIIITLVMMAYTAFFTLSHYPSKAERKVQKQIDAQRSKLTTWEAEIRGMQAEVSRLKDEKNRAAKLKMELMSAEHALLERISACFREARAIFISVNLSRRTDGIVPDCFHERGSLPDMKGFQLPGFDNDPQT